TFTFESHALPTFARCYPHSFTFYVANPIAPFYFLLSSGRHDVCSKVAMFVLSLFALLVLVPAAAALISESSRWQRSSIRPAFSIGAAIVYRQERVASTRATADARDIRPATRGEYYYYSIINYLHVNEVLGDCRLIAVARNHKRLCFRPNVSPLRKA